MEEPIVIFAQDNSGSIVLTEDSSFYRSEYQKNLAGVKSQLSATSKVEEYTFGESVSPHSGAFSFDERLTNISQLLQEIEDRYSNRNVGGIVIATDGIYNQGSNPVYSSSGLDFPIYTIAMGDTTPQKDALIKNIHHNQIAYLGNKFPVVVDLAALQLSGKNFKLQILKEEEVLFEKQVKATTNDFFTSVDAQLLAEENGLQKYTVRLASVEGEVSYRNNVKDFYIEVPELAK